MLEHLKVIFGGATMLWFSRWLMIPVYRPHESNKLSWDYPVEVTILHLLIVFILPWIEILEAIPSELCCYLQTLQAMIYLYDNINLKKYYCALICAIPI
jgi:hypothetical protein